MAETAYKIMLARAAELQRAQGDQRWLQQGGARDHHLEWAAEQVVTCQQRYDEAFEDFTLSLLREGDSMPQSGES